MIYSLGVYWYTEIMELPCNRCGVYFYKPNAWVRKVKNNYCSRKCYGESRVGMKLSEATKKKMSDRHRGELNHEWKGGRYVGKDGYVKVRDIESKKYIREHQLVMEKHIGRKLVKGEVVHHINQVKTDNRLENLRLMSISEHMKLHRRIEGDSRNIHNTD